MESNNKNSISLDKKLISQEKSEIPKDNLKGLKKLVSISGAIALSSLLLFTGCPNRHYTRYNPSKVYRPYHKKIPTYKRTYPRYIPRSSPRYIPRSSPRYVPRRVPRLFRY
jgi:hypothetical protein